MLDGDGQPGLEPVFPGHHPGAPFPQPDHSGLQYLSTSEAEKLDYPAPRFAETAPEIPNDSSLEPVFSDHRPGAPFPQAGQTDNYAAIPDEKIPGTFISDNNHNIGPENFNKTKPSRRRRTILIGAGVAAVVCVILVAVLAGVFVSKSNTKQSKTAASGTISPTTTNSTSNSTSNPSTVTLNQIGEGSDLTVAGWRTDDGIQIFLYYQDSNGTLRYSEYDSGRGSFTSNNSYWEESETLVSTAENTSVAAGMVIWQTTDAPQVELFYLESNDTVSGLSINQYLYPNTGFAQDSINNQSIVATTSSALASYWPYIAFLDDSGGLSVVKNVPYSDETFSPESNWTVTALDVTPLSGSTLSIVPLGTSMSSIESNGYGIFYQDTEGNLAKYQPILTESWPTDAALPTISLPDGGSFAAFTTARSDDDKDRVNTYVLYQVESSSINMVYLDNDSTWTITQPSALGTADMGTSIACLTMPISQSGLDSEALDLEVASNEIARCYFRRDGLLIEVELSGTDWVDMGSIPLT